MKMNDTYHPKYFADLEADLEMDMQIVALQVMTHTQLCPYVTRYGY